MPAGGIVSHGFDADSDTITVVQDTVPASIGMGYAGTTLGVQPDGSFLYTPDVTFVGTDTFVIRLFDGVATSASDQRGRERDSGAAAAAAAAGR